MPPFGKWLLLLAVFALPQQGSSHVTSTWLNDMADLLFPIEEADYEITHPHPFSPDEENNVRKNKEHTRTLQSSSESTHVNIFQKLKESLGQSIIGIILIICMPCLIWWNEGRHVKELKRIEFSNKSAETVDPNDPTDEQIGNLVHFTGTVTVDGSELSTGDGFGVSAPGAVALRRTCSIYQRVERSQQETEQDRLGGGETRITTYTVDEEWMTTPQPEQLPHLPQETNERGIWDSLVEKAGTMPTKITISSLVRVGKFGLSQEIIFDQAGDFLREWDPVPVDLLPESVDGCEGLIKGPDNVLRTYDEADGPQNGDCRVVFEYVPEGFDCSFVVKQTARHQSGTDADVEAPLLSGTDYETDAPYGVDKCVVVDSGCCKYKEGDLGEIWLVQRGTHTLEEMIETAKAEEKQILMLLRLLGWGLMCAGWAMLFAPFVTALQILPLLSKLGGFAVAIVAVIVSCVCCCTVMATAYVRYRPLLGFGMLSLALGIWGIVIWRLNYAAENGGEQQ